MPPLKGVPTLGILANSEVSKQVALSCRRIKRYQAGGQSENYEHACTDIAGVLSELPINLLESIILSTINLILKDAADMSRNSPHCLPTALEILPQPRVTQLDYGQLFTGARLARAMNSMCRAAIRTSLGRTVHLSRLVLSSKCTDDILETIGRNCRALSELHISCSELVTDTGLAWLVPGDSTGCPGLGTVDILKCWNISPAGAQALLLGLAKLRKLLFSNMKSVMEGLRASGQDSQGPFLLEYFDSTEYDLITEYHADTEVMPGNNPACWVSGPVKIMHIPQMFPNITLIKMMLTDSEVQNLVSVTNLVHLEIEFSDEPGAGLQTLLDTHPNISRIVLIFLQVGTIASSHLLSIAKNCTKLGYLRIIGFQVGSSSVLCPNTNYFHSLTQLHLSLYDSDEADSTDEDDEEPQVVRHTPEIITFFMFSAINLQVVSIHMNCDTFLTDKFLHQIFSQNSLLHLSRLSLSGPKDLKLSLATVEWVVASLPSLTRLCVSKWSVGLKELKTLRNTAKYNNYDLVYD